MASAGEESADKKLSVLLGTCTILAKDWWSYEWCHKKEVRQFHLAGPPDALQEVSRPPSCGRPRYNPCYQSGRSEAPDKRLYLNLSPSAHTRSRLEPWRVHQDGGHLPPGDREDQDHQGLLLGGADVL